MPDPILMPALTAKPNAVTFQQIPGGFLRTTYGEDGRLANIATVRRRSKKDPGEGMELYFLDEDYIAFKSRWGLSGPYYSGGVVRFGTVYDDDGPPDPGRPVAKDEWILECQGKMVVELAKPDAK